MRCDSIATLRGVKSGPRPMARGKRASIRSFFVLTGVHGPAWRVGDGPQIESPAFNRAAVQYRGARCAALHAHAHAQAACPPPKSASSLRAQSPPPPPFALAPLPVPLSPRPSLSCRPCWPRRPRQREHGPAVPGLARTRGPSQRPALSSGPPVCARARSCVARCFRARSVLFFLPVLLSPCACRVRNAIARLF